MLAKKIREKEYKPARTKDATIQTEEEKRRKVASSTTTQTEGWEMVEKRKTQSVGVKTQRAKEGHYKAPVVERAVANHSTKRKVQC